MKTQIKMGLFGLLVGFGAIASANQVVLENVSKGDKPLKVEFRVVYVNPDKQTEAHDGGTLTLGRAQIDLPLQGFQQAWIAVHSVNGQSIPGEISASGHKGCVAMTDAQKTNAVLQINFESLPNHHGKVSCKMS